MHAIRRTFLGKKLQAIEHLLEELRDGIMRVQMQLCSRRFEGLVGVANEATALRVLLSNIERAGWHKGANGDYPGQLKQTLELDVCMLTILSSSWWCTKRFDQAQNLLWSLGKDEVYHRLQRLARLVHWRSLADGLNG